MKIVLVLLTLFLSLNAVAQDFQYARAIVDTLASDAMKGRGYVGDGDKIAANFISNEFEQIGLIPYSKNYLQKCFSNEISVSGPKFSAALRAVGGPLVPQTPLSPPPTFRGEKLREACKFHSCIL